MNCQKCGISVDEGPLQRINETGVNGIFWCEPCIQEHEPEFYKNIQEDKTDAEKALEEIFYGKTTPIELCATCGINIANTIRKNCNQCENLKKAMQ